MSNKKEKKLIDKQVENVNKKENKLVLKKRNDYIKNKVDPIKNKIEDKIPEKLKGTLEKAFEKGFKIVFEKGTNIIEKSYDKEKLNIEFDIDNYAVKKQFSKKNIRNIDSKVGRKLLFNKSIGVLEGGILGVLGIGIPDIPIFIGVILKSIYKISLTYGYDYNDEKEKVFILNIICAAATEGEERNRYFNEIDNIAEQIDKNIVVNYDLNEMIIKASKVLSEQILLSKFIQGFAIVGIIGGITNYKILQDISNVAKIKYKKRYLNQIVNK